MWLSRIYVFTRPTVYFQSSIKNNTIIHSSWYLGKNKNIRTGWVLDNAQIHSRKSLIKNTWWFTWEFKSLLANINSWTLRRINLLFNARSYWIWRCNSIWRLLVLMHNILILFKALKYMYIRFIFFYYFFNSFESALNDLQIKRKQKIENHRGI